MPDRVRVHVPRAGVPAFAALARVKARTHWKRILSKCPSVWKGGMREPRQKGHEGATMEERGQKEEEERRRNKGVPWRGEHKVKESVCL